MTSLGRLGPNARLVICCNVPVLYSSTMSRLACSDEKGPTVVKIGPRTSCVSTIFMTARKQFITRRFSFVSVSKGGGVGLPSVPTHNREQALPTFRNTAKGTAIVSSLVSSRIRTGSGLPWVCLRRPPVERVDWNGTASTSYLLVVCLIRARPAASTRRVARRDKR